MSCKRWGVALYVLVLCAIELGTGHPLRAATIIVHFDQDTYYVNGPGDPVVAQVLLDSDNAKPGDTPVRGGLFSFGVLTDYPSTQAQLTNPAQIHVPAELEHFGFDSSAFRAVNTGLAGVKGNVDANTVPTVPYAGTWLATFDFTNLATGPDSYPLNLDFFRTVGVNEQIFVDGHGVSLDNSIVFIPSRVVVLPEPSARLIWPAIGICLAALRRRFPQQQLRAHRHLTWRRQTIFQE